MRGCRRSATSRSRTSARAPETDPPPLRLVPSIATVGAAGTTTTPSTTAAENTMGQTHNDGGANENVDLPAVGPSTPTTEETGRSDNNGNVNEHMEGDVDVDVNVEMEVDVEAAMDERAARRTTFADDVAAGMVTPPARMTPPRPDTPHPAPATPPPSLEAALAAAGVGCLRPVVTTAATFQAGRRRRAPNGGAFCACHGPIGAGWVRRANIGTRRVRRSAATARGNCPGVVPVNWATRSTSRFVMPNRPAVPFEPPTLWAPVVNFAAAALARGNVEMAAAAIVAARMVAGLEAVVDHQLLADVQRFASGLGIVDVWAWIYNGGEGGANSGGGGDGNANGDGGGNGGGGDDDEWPDADLFEDF